MYDCELVTDAVQLTDLVDQISCSKSWNPTLLFTTWQEKVVWNFLRKDAVMRKSSLFRRSNVWLQAVDVQARFSARKSRFAFFDGRIGGGAGITGGRWDGWPYNENYANYGSRANGWVGEQLVDLNRPISPTHPFRLQWAQGYWACGCGRARILTSAVYWHETRLFLAKLTLP